MRLLRKVYLINSHDYNNVHSLFCRFLHKWRICVLHTCVEVEDTQCFRCTCILTSLPVILLPPEMNARNSFFPVGGGSREHGYCHIF